MPTVTPPTATLTTTKYAPVLKLLLTPAVKALITRGFSPSTSSSYLKTGRLPVRAR